MPILKDLFDYKTQDPTKAHECGSVLIDYINETRQKGFTIQGEEVVPKKTVDTKLHSLHGSEINIDQATF